MDAAGGAPAPPEAPPDIDPELATRVAELGLDSEPGLDPGLATKVAEDFFKANETCDGALLFETCAKDAKLYDSQENLFLDMSIIPDVATSVAVLPHRMGHQRIKFSDPVLVVPADDHHPMTVKRTHIIDVFDKETLKVTAKVKVRTILTMNSEHKITECTEIVLQQYKLNFNPVKHAMKLARKAAKRDRQAQRKQEQRAAKAAAGE